MSGTKKLIQSWRKWQHTPKPVEHFIAGQRRAPSYGIECTLDHSATSISGLVRDVLNGKIQGALLARIQEQQDELNDSLVHLEKSELSEEEKQRFRLYIESTQALLEQLME